MRPQTCKKCNRIQYVVWNVSDDLWQKFCRKTGWNESRTICLECFAEMIGFVDLTEFGHIDKTVHFVKLWEEY